MAILSLVNEMKQSIWNMQTQLPAFPRLQGDLKTDVLIVGGGLAGLLCGYRLRQAGIDCMLIEANRICSGVSGNTTAKITSQHGILYGKLLRILGAEKARLYWEANEAAIAEFHRLSRQIPCDFSWKDNYIYSTDSPGVLEAELQALDTLGIPAKFAKEIPLPIPVAGAIGFAKQALFNPLKLAAGLAEGQRIYEHTMAKEFAGHKVVTEQGTITAENILIATHFPVISKHGGYFLKMYQQRSYVMALQNAAQMDDMYLDAAENGLSFRNHGDLLLMGGGGHRTGKQGGGWETLETFAAMHYPEAREVCRWAAQDCMTLDGIPYIGRYGKHTRKLYVATGFNKWGMTSSMVSAMILEDLIRGTENSWEALFVPSRRLYKPQLLYNGVESAVNLLTPAKPRCPHLGCALKWNPREHSWDCPCHGSRFSETGSLLDNPASGDIKKKNLP